MSAKNILSLVIAVVVGIAALKLLWWLMGLALGLLGMLLTGAVVAAVVYALYRVFNNMLGSGKRLT
jgi:hypothetical protein